MINKEFRNKRPQMSDTEINSFKDFDAVLNKVSGASGSQNPDLPSESMGKFNLKSFLKYSKNIFVGAASVAAAYFAYQFASGNGNTDANNQALKDSTASKTTLVEQAPYLPNGKASSAINPPIPGQEKPFKRYTIEVGKAQEITTENGSIIKIPKNCFLDDEGKLITGEVDILFREYHDVLEIFKSGIPMTYDSAGKSYTFESAGMFELQVEKGQKRIQNFDKEIIVDLISKNQSPKFNDYFYDSTINNWVYLSTSALVKEEVKQIPKPVTDDEVIPHSGMDSNEPAMTNSPVVRKRPTEPLKPTFPALLSSKYAFEVDYARSSFPELHPSCVFQVNESANDFSPLYYKIKWDVLELSRTENKGEYMLHLEKGSKKIDVQCMPAISAEERTRLQAKYDLAQKAYQDSLAVWNTYVLATRKSESRATESFYLSEGEQAAMALFMRRRFRVLRPGIRNSDHPKFRKAYLGDQVLASYISEDKEVEVYRSYVVHKKTNALFSSRNGSILFLDKKKNLVAWVWTADNQIGIVSSDQLKDYELTQDFVIDLYDPSEAMIFLENIKDL